MSRKKNSIVGQNASKETELAKCDKRTVSVIETTFGSSQHAQINSSIITILIKTSLTSGVRLFGCPQQLVAMTEFLTEDVLKKVTTWPIAVPASGGVKLSRALKQFWNIWAAQTKVRKVLVLSSGPETFFVCKIICLLRPMLKIFIVLHGNLHDAVGWRSKNPIRRLFDYKSGLRFSKHPRIRLIVLEHSIKSSMKKYNLPNWERTSVIPHPIVPTEGGSRISTLPDTGPLSIGYVGHASRRKGFDKFLRLAREFSVAESGFRFVLAGFVIEQFSPKDLALLDHSSVELSRPQYLQRVNGLNYACLLFDQEIYEFTASASLLDAVSALKPVIALAFPALDNITREFGPVGFICHDLDELRELFLSRHKLLDKVAYARFVANLRICRESRLSEGAASDAAQMIFSG